MPTVTPPAPIDARVGAIFVPVSDIRRSASFYAALLSAEMPTLSHGERICSFPLQEGVMLILDAHRPVASSSQPLCYFTTGNMAAARAHLERLDARIVRGEEDIGSMITLAFEDPDGNLLMTCATKP